MTHVDAAERQGEAQRLDQKYFTIRTAVRWLGGVAIAYVVVNGLAPLAGQSTDFAASVAITALVEIKFVAALTLAGGCAAWAVVERVLRKRQISRRERRLQELEATIERQQNRIRELEASQSRGQLAQEQGKGRSSSERRKR